MDLAYSQQLRYSDITKIPRHKRLSVLSQGMVARTRHLWVLGLLLLALQQNGYALVAPGVIDANQTICTGTAPATITNTISATGTGMLLHFWQQSTTAPFSGYTTIPSTNTTTYTPGVLTVTTWFRRAITNGIDTAYSDPVKITVVNPDINTISTAQTICSGTAPAFLTGTTGSSYLWLSSTTSALTGFTPAAGINNAKDYAPGVLTQHTWYKRVITNGPCPNDTTAALMITVTTPSVGGITSGGGTFCQGPGYTFITLSGHTGSIVKWQSSTSPTFASNITDITFSSSPYPATFAQASSLHYRAIVKNGSCPAETSAISPAVVVIPQTVAGQVTGGTTVCAPTNSTTLTLSGYTGNIIKWQSSLTADFNSPTDIANTSSSLTVTNLTVKTFYRAWVQNGSCTLFFSGKDSVSVYPAAAAGTISGGSTVCPGINSTTLTLTGYTGTIVSWQWSSTRDFSGTINTLSHTASTYTATNLTTKRYYRAVIASLYCAAEPVAYSTIDSVSVVPLAVGGILSGGANVCSATNNTTLTLTGHVGGIVRWESCSTSDFSSGVSNITNFTATLNVVNLGATTYYRALVANSIMCPGVYSSVDSIVVSAPSAGGTVTGADSVCSGSNSTTLTLTGFTGKVIRWESASNSAFTGLVTQISDTTAAYTASNLTAVTYFRAVVQNGNCALAYSAVKAIIVVPVSFGGFISAPTTVCINSNSTNLTITGYAGSILRWESSTTANFSGSITMIPYTGATYTAVNISTPTYYRAVVQNGICPPAYSQVGFINVQPQPDPGSVVGGNTVCVTSNISFLALAGHQGNIVRWESSPLADFSGTITSIPNTTTAYVVNNLTATTYYRAVVQYLNCATVASAPAGIIVSPVSVAGIVSGDHDSVCVPNNSTTFSLTGATGTVQWQASTSSATTGFSNISGAGGTTYTATNLSVKTYFRAIVTSGACSAVITNVDSVVVNPVAAGGTVSSNTGTVCTGNNTSTLTLAGYTGAVQWQLSTTSATSGFTNITGATSSVYTANNLSVKTYFRALVSSGRCGAAISTVDSILINAMPLAGTVTASNNTVCAGINSVVLSVSGYLGSIQWQVSTTSATDDFLSISGATLPTYTATNLATKTYFRAIVSNGTCPVAISPVDSVSISPPTVGGVISGGARVCMGVNSTTLTLTGITGVVSHWQWSNSRTFTSGVNNIIHTGNTYTATNLTGNRYYRAVIVSPDCPSLYPLSYSTIDSIIVAAPPVGGNVSGGITVCSGINSATLTLTSYAGTILRWESSPSPTFSSGVVMIANSTNTCTSTNITSTTYYRVVVQNAGCPFVYSAADSVVAIMSIGGKINEAGDACPVCRGPNSKTLVLSGYTGNILKWQSSPKYDFSSGVVDIANTSNTHTVTNLTASTYYRAIVQLSNCYAVFSSVARISLYPPVIPGTLSGGSQYCAGPNSTTLTLSGMTGGIVRWESCPNAAFLSDVTTIANTKTSLTVVNQPTTAYYRVLVANTAACAGLYSNIDSIIVYPPSAGGVVAGDRDTICKDTNTVTFHVSGHTGSVQWQSSTASARTGFVNISGANTPIYTATNLQVKTYFRVIVKSGLCAADTSAADSVMMNPPPVPGIVTAGNDTVCNNTNATLLTLSGYTGNIQWQSSTASAVEGFADITGATGPTYTASNISATTYYRAAVSNGYCFALYSSVDSVIINPVSVGGTVSGNVDSVCTGSNATVFTVTDYTGTIQWQSSSLSATAGFANIAGATAATYTANNLSANLYVRAIVTNGICPSYASNTDSVIISALSTGGEVSGDNDSVCSFTNTTTFTLSGYSGTIQWQSSVTSATAGFTDIAGADQATYTAANLSAKTYFRAVVSSGACPVSISTTDSVSIRPTAVAGTVSVSQNNVCLGLNATTFTLNGASGFIQWQSSTTSATAGFSNIIGANAATYVANNLTSKTYIRAIVTEGVCPVAISLADSVLVNPLNNGGMLSGGNQVCTGVNSTTLTLSGEMGIVANWQWSSSRNFSTGVSNIANTNNTYTETNLTSTRYYRAVIVSGDCPSYPVRYSIIDSIVVNVPAIGGAVTGGSVVCAGANNTRLVLGSYAGEILRWESSADRTFSSGVIAIPNTSDSLFAQNLGSTLYYRAVLQNAGCPLTLSAPDSVVTQKSVGGTLSELGDGCPVCPGPNSRTLTLSGQTGAIVKWQSAPVLDFSSGVTDITHTSNTYTASNTSVSTYYRALVQVSNCYAANSSPARISVLPQVIPGVLSGGTEYCDGPNYTTLTLSGMVGGVVKWEASADPDFSEVTDILSGDTFLHVADLASTTYYRVLVANSDKCPGAFSTIQRIGIYQPSVAGIIAADDDSLCSSGNTTRFRVTGNTGGVQWQASTTSARMGFKNIPGATDNIYTINDLSAKTYFRVVVSNGPCDADTSVADSIFINPVSVGGIVSAAADTVCANSAAVVLSLSGSTGTIQWQSSTTSADEGFSNISGAMDTVLTVPGLSDKTYFRAIVTSGDCDPSISPVDSVLIYPRILNNTITGNSRICYGSGSGLLTGAIPAGGNGSGYTYLWLSSTVGESSGFVPAPGLNTAKDYAPGVLTRDTWFKRIVSSAPCSVDTSNTILDTVSLEIAYITQPAEDTIEYGSPLPETYVLVTYVDSSTEMRPLVFDTTALNPNIGTYDYAATIGLAEGTCNTANLTAVLTITVIPRTVVVKADIKIKEKGTSDPPLTYTIVSGSLVGADTFSGYLTRMPGEEVGRYPILQHTLSLSSNYNLIYMQDSLTITINLMKLTVSKTTPVPSVYSGDSVFYTIRVSNFGPDSLQPGQALSITDQPAPGLTVGGYQTTHGVYDTSTRNLVLNGSFLPGQYVELMVRAKVDTDYRDGSVGNFVLVLVPDYILNTGESKDSAYVLTTRRVDLDITKTVANDTAQTSDTVAYTITVVNNGPAKLYKGETIRIVDYLPAALTDIVFTPLLPAGSNYDETSSTFTLGDDLLSGDAVSLALTGIIRLDYTGTSIVNRVKTNVPPNVYDPDPTNDSAWVILPLLQRAVAANIIASDIITCKGNTTTLSVSSAGIVNPVYTWYADSLLTIPIGHFTQLDTLLLSTTSFFITVKGDNRSENIPGRAKKITVSVFDYASDTLILTHDTVVCYRKPATLIAKPKGVITDPVFTWYALPSLNVPIATGDTFNTDILTADTLYYVTIKGSSLCESRELHIVKVTINKDCGNINIGLAKSLAKSNERTDGSFDLTFNFVTKNFGDEPLTAIRLKDDLKPVFPAAQINVVSLTTAGNWNLNPNYDGVGDIELLDTGNNFGISEQQSIQLVINLVFPPNDTSTQFKNTAEISGISMVNGKPTSKKSKDGISPDSSIASGSFVPTPIVIKRKEKPKEQTDEILFIPEGFSPNGDQVNDYFVIENTAGYSLSVAIYNRWGNIVYEHPDYDNSWDGKAQKGMIVGEGVPDGTYFYIVEYIDAEGNKQTKTHSLTILR